MFVRVVWTTVSSILALYQLKELVAAIVQQSLAQCIQVKLWHIISVVVQQ